MRNPKLFPACLAFALLGFLAGRITSSPLLSVSETASQSSASPASSPDRSSRDLTSASANARLTNRRSHVLASEELISGVQTILDDWKGEIDLLVPAGEVDPDRQPLLDLILLNRLSGSVGRANARETAEILELFEEDDDDSMFTQLWGSVIELQSIGRELELEGTHVLDRAIEKARSGADDDSEAIPLSWLVFSLARISPQEAEDWVEGVIQRNDGLPEHMTAEMLRAAIQRAQIRKR